MEVVVNHPTTGDTSATACDSYTWHGKTYTESGEYKDTLTNAMGCDSIVTLNLTIKNKSYGTDTQEACDSYTWIDGNTYTESNNTATFTMYPPTVGVALTRSTIAYFFSS